MCLCPTRIPAPDTSVILSTNIQVTLSPTSQSSFTRPEAESVLTIPISYKLQEVLMLQVSMVTCNLHSLRVYDFFEPPSFSTDLSSPHLKLQNNEGHTTTSEMKTYLRARGMAQQLGAHIALGEDTASIWRFITNSCNSISGNLDLCVLRGQLQKLRKVHTHIHEYKTNE